MSFASYTMARFRGAGLERPPGGGATSYTPPSPGIVNQTAPTSAGLCYHSHHWTQDIAVMNNAFCVVAAAVIGSLSVYPACANDTAAELSIGGLQFSRTTAVTLENEALKISPDQVSVRYQFRNTTAAPVKLTVALSDSRHRSDGRHGHRIPLQRSREFRRLQDHDRRQPRDIHD